MLTEASADTDDRTSIVVSGSLAVRQWEAHLSTRGISAGAGAWVTPPLISYSGWLESLWLGGRKPRPVPLTPPQSLALWRRVIGESAEGAELIGPAGAAEWAADAWQLLCRWGIDPERERPGDGQGDFRAFLVWCRTYRRALADNGWVDRAEIARQLPTIEWPAPARVVFADLDEPSPLHRTLLERLARAGSRVEALAPPALTAELRRTKLADAAEELRAAIDWAQRRLAATPAARIALVVPDAAQRRGELERALARRSAAAIASPAAPVWFGAPPLGANPRIAAALNALSLGAGSATFESLSRFLRSPFFADASEQSARAALERDLRREVRSQLPFATAYRETALADVLRRRTPLVAAALEAALRETAGISQATPSRWARAWQRALTALGWDGTGDARALPHWQNAVEDFARLTPITGDLSYEAALAELERALGRITPDPLPLRGVHVLAQLDDVGPGYDAAWVTGFTDANWPEPGRCNPLLPRTLQRAHGMPWSTPKDARLRCERRLERLERRVKTLVASWPARVYDFETEPSPAVRSWQAFDAGEVAPRVPSEQRRETVDDPAPPVPGRLLRGGAGALQRQARCPVRAFCQDRLGARELERVGAGLGGRLRGVAAHRALQLLLEDTPAQADLGHKAAELPAIVERALSEAFRDAQRPLRALFAIEAERLTAALRGLLEADRGRAPFTVVAVEREQIATIAGRELRIRIDRLDRLADGSVAIIDYKTGDRAQVKDWLKERPLDVQVPLYAAYSSEPVGAAAIARVRPRDCAYFGFWNAAVLFPGTGQKLPDKGWPQLLAQWRAQIEELVLELAGGDARIFLDGVADAAGAYAPLTRVHEQVALARGSVARW